MATDYTIVNDKTGEEKVISWEGKAPPTQEDIAHITLQLDANSGVPKQKVGDYPIAASLNGQGVEPKNPKKPSLLETWKEQPIRKTIADFSRPLLEGGGMVAGGLVGVPLAPETLGLSSVAGAALGYAGGKGIADMIEGVPAKDNLLQQFASTAGDVATGATYDMGGQLAGKYLIDPAVSLAGRIIADPGRLIPLGKKAAEREAAAIWSDSHTGPASQAATEQDTRAVMERIKAPADLTPAQLTGNTKAARQELAMASKNNELAAQLKNNDQAIASAAADNLTSTMGNPGELPIQQTAESTGSNILKRIKERLAPAQQTEREAWSNVPGGYDMPHTTFQDTLKEVMGSYQHMDAMKALKAIASYYKSAPKTVQGLRDVESTIGDKIRQYVTGPSPDKNTARVLGKLKDAITSDFEAMGSAATSGDVALHQGQIVYPSQIQSEISALEKSIAQETGAAVPLREQNSHLRQALHDNKGGWVPMQNTGITDAQYSNALRQELERQQSLGAMLDYTPPASITNQQKITDLTSSIAQKRGILDNLQPATDVAAAIRAAKDATIKKQRQFYTGTNSNTLNLGNQSNGMNMTPEQVTSAYFTPAGSRDLVTSVGKADAASLMTPHAAGDMISRSSRPDGTLDINRALSWIRKNSEPLNTLGLTRQMEGVVKEQIPAAIRAHLESKGLMTSPDTIVEGARSAAQFARRFEPAIRKLYGNSSREVIALNDYAKTIEILARRHQSGTAGSNSIDKLFGDAPKGSLAGKIFDGLAGLISAGSVGHMAGGSAGGMAGLAVGATSYAIRQHQIEMAKKILTEAVTNPEVARMLMDIGKGRIVTPARFQSVTNKLITYSLFSSMADTPEPASQPLPDPLGIRR